MDPYRNAFGDSGSAFNARWGDIRGRALQPLLFLLAACRVHPNFLSACAVLAAAASGILFIVDVRSALAALLLHLLFDAIDGPLARYRHLSSEKGAFLDLLIDEGGLIFITLGLSAAQLIDPTLLISYIATYLSMIFLLVGIAARKGSAGNIIRSRDLFYASVILELGFGIPLIHLFLIIFTTYNALSCLFLSWKIHSSLS